MKYELYFWCEEGQIEPAADSLRVRLAEDHNLPGVKPLSLATIQSAFRRHFPHIIITDSAMLWDSAGTSFQVSFWLNDRNEPIIISVSSETALADSPQIFDHVIAATRELGCTRIESAIR